MTNKEKEEWEKRKWRIPKIEFHETAAFQALERGEATSDQQKMILHCLLHKICGTYDETFDLDNDRIASYYQGRRSVGLLIVKEIKLSLTKLAEKNRKNQEEKNK